MSLMGATLKIIENFPSVKLLKIARLNLFCFRPCDEIKRRTIQGIGGMC